MTKKAIIWLLALVLLVAVALSGCQLWSATFTGTLDLNDYQKTTLEEAGNIIGLTVPMPTYLPEGYEVQEVYIKDTGNSTEWIVALLISDGEIEWIGNEYQCQMRITVYWRDVGGLKMPWAERVKIGDGYGMLEKEKDHNDLSWIIRPGRKLVLSAGKDIPTKELTKIAESVNTAPEETIKNTIPDNQGETSITLQPEPGSYLRNAFDEPSAVILKGVQVEADICDKEYFSPWYPSHAVKKGDPCLVVSGHIQNMHEENSEIAMYAEGYDTSGEQVAWTLDAAHISGQIGLHLKYEETGEFTLHLNLSENTSTVRIYANNYSVVPP
jgi:hypothetical protein